jgi:hypothetical protein
VRRVGRLGLAGLVGVEERQHGPAVRDEAAGEAGRDLDHPRHLLVGCRRRQIARTHRAEAVDLVDDDEARLAGGGAVLDRPDRQLGAEQREQLVHEEASILA